MIFFFTFLKNERIQSKEEKHFGLFSVDCDFFFFFFLFLMYTDDLKGYTGVDRCSPLGRFLFTVQ